jgi:hypothetical protein
VTDQPRVIADVRVGSDAGIVRFGDLMYHPISGRTTERLLR